MGALYSVLLKKYSKYSHFKWAVNQREINGSEKRLVAFIILFFKEPKIICWCCRRTQNQKKNPCANYNDEYTAYARAYYKCVNKSMSNQIFLLRYYIAYLKSMVSLEWWRKSTFFFLLRYNILEMKRMRMRCNAICQPMPHNVKKGNFTQKESVLVSLICGHFVINRFVEENNGDNAERKNERRQNWRLIRFELRECGHKKCPIKGVLLISFILAWREMIQPLEQIKWFFVLCPLSTLRLFVYFYLHGFYTSHACIGMSVLCVCDVSSLTAWNKISRSFANHLNKTNYKIYFPYFVHLSKNVSAIRKRVDDQTNVQTRRNKKPHRHNICYRTFLVVAGFFCWFFLSRFQDNTHQKKNI